MGTESTSLIQYSSQLVDADDEEEEPDELLDMYFWTEPPTLAYSNDPPSYAHACGQPEGHVSRGGWPAAAKSGLTQTAKAVLAQVRYAQSYSKDRQQ